MDNNIPGNIIKPTPEGSPANNPQAPEMPTPQPIPAVETPPAEPSPVSQQPMPTPVPTATPATAGAAQPQAVAAPLQASNYSAPKPASSKRKLLLVGVAAAFVILGGGASAYFGYVVPNKPEKKLVAVFTNLASQTQMTVSGTIDYAAKNENGTSMSLGYKLETNTDKNQLKLGGTIGVKGTQFPYELLYVDKNIYAKVAGLESIGSLMSSVSGGNPSVAAMYGSMLSEINDQWYVIDRSFWQEMGSETSCVTELNFVFNDDDINMIKSAYAKHPLFSINSTSADTVDGSAVTKYDLTPSSNETAKAFASELNDLSVVKKIRECLNKTPLQDSLDEELDTPLGELSEESEPDSFIVYVDSKKQLKKIEITDETEEQAIKITANFVFSDVSVSAPEGAKPLQDLVSNIMGGLLMSGAFDFGSAQTVGRDTERKNELKNLQMKLETYFGDYGKYPLTGQLLSLNLATEDELTGPNGETYTYSSDGNTYTLSAKLENADDRDADNGLYVLHSINAL